ncbi:hypothetical protein [Streptomyces sp. NPDC002851]
MRAISLTSLTLASAGALALACAPTAAHTAVSGDEHNITSFGFSVSPTTVAPGGQVTLKVDGCEHNATASSGVFDTVTIPKGQSSATAHVDPDAKPGARYTVTFECKGEKGTTDLTIASGGGHTGGHTGGVHKGVKAGIGGSSGDLDLGEIALGAALIAGALGSAVHWARRRPTEDGS